MCCCNSHDVTGVHAVAYNIMLLICTPVEIYYAVVLDYYAIKCWYFAGLLCTIYLQCYRKVAT
jgi:hypothetical protein